MGYTKQYIFDGISFGLFCRDINFGICIYISITIKKYSVIFVTICLTDIMRCIIKHDFYSNRKIIICSDEFNKLLYFVFSNFIEPFGKYTPDTGILGRVNIFIFEFFFYPKYQVTHLNKQTFSFCFIASFAFVLQRHRAKPIPLKMHASKGSPCGRAPAIAGERVLCVQLSPLRRLRRHLSQRARLFVSSIITQIGRENNHSAEICL